MLGNVYVDKIYGGQCLYIISLCFREGFSHPLSFFVVQRNPLCLILKQLGRKDFSMENFPIGSYMLLCKQKNSIWINQ